MKALRRRAVTIRWLSFLTALFVVAFIVDSAPHRVHHLFENVQFNHNHEDTDSRHSDSHPTKSASSQPDCVFQSVAGHCHLSSTPPVHLASFQASSEDITFSFPDRIPYLVLVSSFQIRAPPYSA